jgi:NAD(P)-dependent dehydrogenase (short-subunit alcohol dehydrogenase family)
MAGILISSIEEFQNIININLIGTFLLCRETLPYLIKTKGNIINAASTSTFFGHPYMAAYSASKGGIASMTKSLAWEYMLKNVRVNAIAPGVILTPLSEKQKE